MATPVIEMRGIWTQFGNVIVHKNLEFLVQPGEVVSLVGGSGSGKTTMLKQILGLLQPTRGEIHLFGKGLHDPDPFLQRSIRRRLGMLFQQGALFSAFSVYDNIAFPLRELKALNEEWIRELVFLKLAMVELEPKHASLMPSELSGGMVKRVALARALALEPELLLLDEPTAGLDPVRSKNFVALIKALQKSLGFTVVLVTHDIDTIYGLGSDVAILAEQRILIQGPLNEVVHFDHPVVHQFFADHRTSS